MRAVRLSASLASRYVPARSYAAAAPRVEFESVVEQAEPEAESSTAAQRRLLRRTTPTETSDKPKRRRGPNALALLRAQKLAKALKESPPPSNSTIPLTTSLIPSPSTAPAPTLEDLEEKRPKQAPPPLHSPKYGRVYQKQYESLDVAFTAKQLAKLAPKLGVKVHKGRGKGLAIKGILESWGWDSPPTSAQQESRRRRESEMVDRDWTLTKAELWLLMRDTEGLRPALEQGVKFSIPPELQSKEKGPIRVLRGTGGADSLEELDIVINEKREAIARHSRSIDHLASSTNITDLMGIIAAATGAYIERDEHEAVRITSTTAETLDKATLLLGQAAQHTQARSSSSTAILAPSADLQVGLYPHLPAPSASIPWQDLAHASKPLFRLRRVQQWEAKVGPRETVHAEEKLDDMEFLTVSGSVKSQGIGEMVASRTGPGRVTTTARVGHVLYANSRSEGTSLTPPVNATWAPADAASSQILSGPATFLPSLPPSLIHFPLEQKPTIRRELSYRHDDGRILQFLYDVPPKAIPGTASPKSEAGWQKELDAYMDRLDLGVSDAGSDVKPEEAVIRANLSVGKPMEVMMPDRPIDLSIASTTSEVNVHTDLYSTMSTYLQSPTSSPPAIIQHDEAHWNLLSSLELEIAESEISVPGAELTVDLDLSGGRTVLRTVKAVDLTFGPDRFVRYAELETEGEVSHAFWTELARVSRVLAPGAGALRAEVY